MLRVLICDDSGEARKLVRTLLSGHPEIEIVGEAANGLEAVSLSEELTPDVVLMDIAMPELDGIEATKRIREAMPETRIVAFTGVDDAEAVQRMLEAGASSYSVKGAPPWELERAIAGASQPLLRLAHALARSFSQRGVAGLVARETAELSGAAIVAVYLASDLGLTIAALDGASAPTAEELPTREPPEVARRAQDEAQIILVAGRDLVDIYRRLGVPCSSAIAVPLLADGERLGVLLAVMPANVQFDLDVELIRAVADIASGALASERRLAETHLEPRRDALTGGKDRFSTSELGQPPAPAHQPRLHALPTPLPSLEPPRPLPESSIRLLVVDDHENLRMLLRTTFEIIDIDVDEAGTAEEAEVRISSHRPDAIVLDVALPGEDGLALCRRLKANEMTADVPIILLTGASDTSEEEGREAGADAFVTKPFSPLELLSTIERLLGRLPEGPFRLMTDERPEEQLLLYAHDLRRLLELERSQRLFIQTAYEETVTALARALESKDVGTGAHSQRVTRYAKQLAHAFDPELLRDSSLEYGFLLHDIGKIGIPDRVLLKAGALTKADRRVIETHTVLGEQILQRVPLLQGEGLRVIRSHHERWNGTGYPDRLEGERIPVGARIFSVADALDAMTTDRPSRKARTWSEAVEEIFEQSEQQFDPKVVEAFEHCEPQLRRAYLELGAA